MVTFYTPPKKQNLLNKTLDLTITRLDQNGCGVAEYKKRSVFIENTLPCEKVQVKVIEQSSKYIKAKLIKLNSISDHRVKPLCRHFQQCGGCNFQHLSHSAQIEFKKNKVEQLFSREGLQISLPWQQPIIEDPYHYRRKARIGVQYNKNGKAIVGFRLSQSNHLIDVQECKVLSPEISDVFVEIKSLLDQLSAHKSVGHVEVISANKICIVIRQLVSMPESDKVIWSDAEKHSDWEVFIDNGQSITSLNELKGNDLFYLLNDGTQINFSTNDFIQVNNKVNQLMVEQAIEWLALKTEDNVLDLFCGLGNFSLPIAKKVSSVVGVEGVQSMVDKAQANAQFNHISNCQFYQTDLNSKWQDNLWKDKSFNKIILDPARAGAEQTIEQIQHYDAEKIVYVSCEPMTLARDTALLIKQGYKVEKIALMDMFSQTKHIETMVLFVSVK